MRELREARGVRDGRGGRREGGNIPFKNTTHCGTRTPRDAVRLSHEPAEPNIRARPHIREGPPARYYLFVYV